MGQKVHPLGFRVGITKKHQSEWFARFQKYGYSQSVYEDHMLRKTLLNLFANAKLASEAGVKQSSNERSKKSGSNLSKTPQITQIKIERGLIPYEIGIQIHSDDCLAMTKAIDNVQLSQKLATSLQKTRQYLLKVGTQLKQTVPLATIADSLNQRGASLLTSDKTSTETIVGGNTENSKTKLSKKQLVKKRKFKMKNLSKKTNFIGYKKFKQKKKQSTSVYMRLKNLKKRFKKRQNIKKRYLNIIAKGLLLRKKGNLILRNVKTKPNFSSKSSNGQLRAKYTSKKVQRNTLTTKIGGFKQNVPSALTNPLPKTFSSQKSRTKKTSLTTYKKFANLFLQKLNKQFLLRLKSIMKFWHNQKLTQAPLGANKKWSKLKNIERVGELTNLGLDKLTNLIFVLEKKSLVKMEALRKDYITFGTLSKIKAFGYYQLITFLKKLKAGLATLKKQTSKTKLSPIKSLDKLSTSSNEKLKSLKLKMIAKSKQKQSITEKLILKNINFVDNNQAITNESRKIKWISYLKDLVNKHRTENIFYYLATIADARKDLKALRRYTKQHQNFLFGNLDTILNPLIQQDNENRLLQRVRKTLIQTTSVTNLESLTLLQKAFLTRIENQRKIYKANLALIPKISIKFFSVQTSDILEKASIVADLIVDALEKRKAFRGVIKKSKEDLMRRPRVKGVKIQVSGRLNGAEIARSEWVRAGRVPLQTLRANLDYSYRTANTIYGIIGVRVWIFKGYSKI
jgi:ribosomal protein S3